MIYDEMQHQEDFFVIHLLNNCKKPSQAQLNAKRSISRRIGIYYLTMFLQTFLEDYSFSGA